MEFPGDSGFGAEERELERSRTVGGLVAGAVFRFEEDAEGLLASEAEAAEGAALDSDGAVLLEVAVSGRVVGINEFER